MSVPMKAAMASLSSSSSFLKFIGGLLGFRLGEGQGQEFGSSLGLLKPASKCEVLASYIEFAGVVGFFVALSLGLIAEQNALVRIVVLHGCFWLV